MLTIFHESGKTPWLSEVFQIWARGKVIESPQNWIMWVKMLSNPRANVVFNDLIIEVISSFLMETVLMRLSVFINNEGHLLLFSKGVHWQGKS